MEGGLGGTGGPAVDQDGSRGPSGEGVDPAPDVQHQPGVRALVVKTHHLVLTDQALLEPPVLSAHSDTVVVSTSVCLSVSLSVSLSHTHTHTLSLSVSLSVCLNVTHTHTHTLSLSLSVSLSVCL